VRAIAWRTAVSFYDDQMTHHAAALTYYALMSLFPALLLGLSLLGLLGEYPATYDAIMGYLREVTPSPALAPLDASLRGALESKGAAATTFAIGVVVALYGTTGGRFAEDLLGFAGFGPAVADVWNVARWPAALAVATLIFALVYYVTPDVEQRSFRWVTPGAAVAVLVWLGASYGFSAYISRIADVGAIYGTFAGAIVLVAWLWLTNVALLLGAELDAEIERAKQLTEGVPPEDTLDLPPRG